MQVSSQWVWSSHCFLSSDPVSIKTWMQWARIAFCRMERYSRSLWARAGELICPWNRTVKENYWPERKANEYSWSLLTCNEMKAFARPIIAHQALRELLICFSKDTGFGIAGAVGVTPWLSLWWSAVHCLLHRPSRWVEWGCGRKHHLCVFQELSGRWHWSLQFLQGWHVAFGFLLSWVEAGLFAFIWIFLS